MGTTAGQAWDEAWGQYIAALRAGDEAGIAAGRRRLRELDRDFADRVFGWPAVASMRAAVSAMGAGR